MGGSQAKQIKHIRPGNPHVDWQIIDELGSGTYGKVHKVRHRTTGQLAAAKAAPVTEDMLHNFADEVAILATCQHRSVTAFVDGYYHDNHLWMMIEICEGGSLSDIMRKRKSGFSELENRCIARQLLDGLAFLHGQLVIHRDLNASNILLGRGGIVKLADFGVSAKLKGDQRKRTSFIGTPNWMAPEVVACEKSKLHPYSFAVDIWSFGITLIELGDMKAPHHEMHPMKVLFKIVSAPPPTFANPDQWSHSCNDFLAKCVVKDPHARPQAVVLLQHEFVQIQDCTTPLLQFLPDENAAPSKPVWIEQPDSLPDSPTKDDDPEPPHRPSRRKSEPPRKPPLPLPLNDSPQGAPTPMMRGQSDMTMMSSQEPPRAAPRGGPIPAPRSSHSGPHPAAAPQQPMQPPRRPPMPASQQPARPQPAARPTPLPRGGSRRISAETPDIDA